MPPDEMDVIGPSTFVRETTNRMIVPLACRADNVGMVRRSSLLSRSGEVADCIDVVDLLKITWKSLKVC